MKSQLSKLTPQVRTKGNHADYSIYRQGGDIKEHILDSLTRTLGCAKADTIERLS